jgi:hypothetical protein
MNTVNADNFNDTMKGYLIRACKEAEYTEEERKRLFGALRWAIDEMTMSDARKEYDKYLNNKIIFE